MYQGEANFVASGDQSIDADKLWKHYSVTLGFIIFFLITFFVVSELSNRIADDDTRKIHESSGQRVLSQRILYFSERLSHHRTEDTKLLLKNSIDKLIHTHTKLMSEPNISNALKVIYFDEEKGLPLDALIQNFIRVANIVLTGQGDVKDAYDSLQVIGPAILHDRLNDALAQYELEAQKHKQVFKVVSYLLFLLAAAVILMEAIFIFFPTFFRAGAQSSSL